MSPLSASSFEWGAGTVPENVPFAETGSDKASKSAHQVILGLGAQGDIYSTYGSTSTVDKVGLRTYFLWQWKPVHPVKLAQVYSTTGSSLCDQLGNDPDKVKESKTPPSNNPDFDKFQACQDLNKYIQQSAKNTPRHTVTFNLRGFLPGTDTTAYGHASAMAEYDYKLSSNFSLSFSVLDSYYSTVAKGYDHNSLIPTFNVKFTPQ